MKAANAAKLCDERGFPWCLKFTGNPFPRGLDLEIATAEGAYRLPIDGESDVNGEVLVTVLQNASLYGLQEM